MGVHITDAHMKKLTSSRIISTLRFSGMTLVFGIILWYLLRQFWYCDLIKCRTAFHAFFPTHGHPRTSIPWPPSSINQRSVQRPPRQMGLSLYTFGAYTKGRIGNYRRHWSSVWYSSLLHFVTHKMVWFQDLSCLSIPWSSLLCRWAWFQTMDGRWLEGIDEGMYMWWISYWIGHTDHLVWGFSWCQCWLCAISNGALCCGIHECLLRCPSKLDRFTISWVLSGLCRHLSWPMHHLSWGWTLCKAICTTPTCFDAFLPRNTPLRLTQWPLLVNHGVEAYSRGQNTLADV